MPGVHVNNPVGGKFGKDQQEKLASVYTFAMGFEPSEKFFLSTEIVKEQDQPVNVNAGFNINFSHAFSQGQGFQPPHQQHGLASGYF